ncbi:hypothetical protein KIW84_063627 [Lathyrus oleraceus]|uniref:C2 NT-type domain-containing protein n=1 Tax=Pisum sativum TaxID=3888 RepID=A0A9D5A7Z3_PEA|nr:hypothetical protein KIW84_063627 [Pisum sativum]
MLNSTPFFNCWLIFFSYLYLSSSFSFVVVKMVLGIRTKSRKTVSNSIQVHYIIHVYEIKPWPPSQSLRSLQSLLLQWQNGDRNSGSLPSSTVGDGKIEFNEPFKLSVSMLKKEKKRESFKKNHLEFQLYDRTVKSQLIGSATLNFADFGIIEETKAICFQLNCKKSFKSSVQPLMYVSIQPFDVECSSSSPSSSLSKELSMEKEERESVSQSINDDDDNDNDDLEIASFTDDETDDIASNNLQTIRSASKDTRGSGEIGEGGSKGANGEGILPSEIITSSLHVNTKAGSPSHINDIKSPSSSPVLGTGVGNVENGSPSSPKISKRSVKVADASSEKQERIQQSPSSSPVLRSGIGNVENDRPSLPEISKRSVKVADASSEIQERIQQSPSSSPVLRSGIGNVESGRPSLPEISKRSVKVADASSEIQERIQQSPSSSPVLRSGIGNVESGRPSLQEISKRSVKVADASSEIQERIQQSPSSSPVLHSGIRNVENGRPSLQEISKRSVKVADASSEIQERIQQSPSSSLVLHPGIGNVENGRPSLPEISKRSVKVADASSEIQERIQPYPSSSPGLRLGIGNVENGRPSSPKISKRSVKVADASSEIQERIQQSRWQDISVDRFKAISPSSNISSSIRPHFETSSQSQVLPEDSVSHGDNTENRLCKEHVPKKVGSVRNTGVMEDKLKKDKGRKGREQFTTSNGNFTNVLDNNFSDDESTRTEKLNSDSLLLSKKSHEQPTIFLTNEKSEDMRSKMFPLQTTESYGQFMRSQNLDQEEKINTSNGVHVDAACHKDVNVNVSSFIDNSELKAEVERLREELREAAALEASMYSVIAEHGSSNKVHAPARRLSRFYFHARRVGSPAKIASAAQSVVSGFVLVSKACGNDVPRLTFWFSNLLLLRAIVSKGVENKDLGNGPCLNGECYVNGSTSHDKERENTEEQFHGWLEPETFLVALEKVEAWMFSRIIESVWWQTLTPYMQSAAAKSSSSRKTYAKRYTIGDQDQGNFSIDLWKRAFKDACERLCPLRGGGLECGCLHLISRMVMEQLVNRLDVAMFNAILRESADEMPTDPISDPISDSKVLPIASGKSGFGAGAQLKNAVGDWSRWLSDLFGIDDCDSLEDNNENDFIKYEYSFKPFPLLNTLSDLMMLPFEMLADRSMRKEVCPRLGISLIRQVIDNFVPDEFTPGPVPNAVIETLNNEDIADDEGSITSFPCSAGSTSYAPPPASSVVSMLKEVGTPSLKSASFMLKKLYTSDDELDELDSPLSALGMDDSKKMFAVVKEGRKVVRYELLKEVWKSSE